MAADAHISPTAHYTSYVWFANGMSHEALTSRLGRVLYGGLAPMNAAHRVLGRGPNLEMSLLMRHRLIDHLLGQEIERGRIGQVIEIAAGLSPRGYRFARRYRDRGLIYVEGDLPAMADHKRRALAAAGLGGPNHHVVTVDALADGGEDSLAAQAARLLDPARGAAIVTEGLLGYFDLPSVHGMWRRFARCLSAYPQRLYLADLFFAADVGAAAANGFRRLLEVFTRRPTFAHYDGDAAAAAAELRAAGFSEARLHAPSEFRDVLPLPGLERGEVARILEGR